MKKISFLVLTLSLLYACNDNKNKNDSLRSDSTGKIPGDTVITEKTKDLQQLKESLGQLNPLTEDAMKALLPSRLMGSDANEIKVSSASGPLEATTDYKLNDSSSIRLTVIDCGGTAGAGYFSMQYMDTQEENSSEDEVSTRMVQFGGYKAFESCMKNNPNSCIFTFFEGSRFLVYLETSNAGIDILKQAAGELNLK